MVRSLINDLDRDPVYSDDKVEQAIVVAGLIVGNEFDFNVEYTFDIDNPSISPDPTSSSTYDSEAIGLIALKAACMLNLNSYQKSVSNGIMVRDGDSQIDLTAGFGGFKDIILYGPCKSYEKLIQTRSTLKSMGLGRAVMTPVSHVDFRNDLGNLARFYDSLGC